MNQPNGNRNCQHSWGLSCSRSNDNKHHCMLIISRDAERHSGVHRCLCGEQIDEPTNPQYPENWGLYPAPHYDEDDVCRCPDHVAMRADRRSQGTGLQLRDFLDSW